MTIEHGGRFEQTRNGQHHASLNLRYLNTLKVQRRALSGERLICCAPVDLNAANTCLPLRRKNLDFLFLCHFSGDERAGGDCTETFHCETAVHGKAKNVICVFRPRFPHEFPQCFDELRNALACIGADTQNRRVFEKAPFQKLANLDFDEIHNVGFDSVDFCKYREPLLDMKQRADV